MLALGAVSKRPAAIKPTILHGERLISKTPSATALMIRYPRNVDGQHGDFLPNRDRIVTSTMIERSLFATHSKKIEGGRAALDHQK